MSSKGNWLIGVASVAVLGGVLAGCGGSGDDSVAERLREALRRMNGLGSAVLLYAADHDDILPLGPNWMDAVEPYAPSTNVFQSPGVANGQYGIALNQAVVGVPLNTLDRPNTILAFDTTVLGRNVVAAIGTQPNPGRFDGVNALVYADGRVPGFPPEPNINASIDNVRRLGQASLLYAADNDDLLPSGNWMDRLEFYEPLSTAYRSPLYIGTANYGYALNSAVAGVNTTLITNPDNTELLFDSTVLSRNASTTTATLPNPGRYEGRNAIVFVSGSARGVRP